MPAKLYLNEFGELKQPEDLSQHHILSMVDEHLDQHIIVHNDAQQQKKIRVNPVVMGSDLSMLAQLVRKNCGIALLPDSIVQDMVKSGELVQCPTRLERAPTRYFSCGLSFTSVVYCLLSVCLSDYLIEHLSANKSL